MSGALQHREQSAVSDRLPRSLPQPAW